MKIIKPYLQFKGMASFFKTSLLKKISSANAGNRNSVA